MNRKSTRAHILELCSEDAYTSWEFWIGEKTDEQCKEIVQTVADLVKEKKLHPLRKFPEGHPRGTYEVIPFDIERLEREVKESMHSEATSDEPYMFFASGIGRQEDFDTRSKQPN